MELVEFFKLHTPDVIIQQIYTGEFGSPHFLSIVDPAIISTV